MGQLITGAGFTGTIGGNITVYGTAERQTITVADVPGTVTFDPSFNKGGDTIVLGKSAGSFTIAQSGSTVVLTSGDRKVIIPVGVAANTIQFADGDRTLIYSGGFKLGDQTVTTTAAAIAAVGSAKSALAADASTFTARLVLSGENASVGGNVSVYGSSAAEAVSLVGGGNITFDPSFNKGGDIISFVKSAINYTAQRSGSSILIKDGASTISIPVGTAGLTADFNGDKRSIVFSNGDFKIGAEAISGVTNQKLMPAKVVSMSYEIVKSAPLTSANYPIALEALNIADINGDGKLDIVMANGGVPTGDLGSIIKTAITSQDRKTTILINDGLNHFQPIDMSKTAPTGWVNDWIFLDIPQNGNPYIIGIDHGREVDFSGAYWEKLKVFQYVNGSVVELTNSIKDNVPAFWHNSLQTGDLNGDNLPDFVVANLSGSTFSVFYGDAQNIFKESKLDAKYYNQIGSAGASAMLDIGGDGDLDFVLFPYAKYGDQDYSNADAFIYQDAKFASKSEFNVRLPGTPDNFGYCFARVADLNNDGLDDIVALLESNQAVDYNLKMIAVMIQNKTGSFDVAYIRDENDTTLGSMDAASTFFTNAKFELVDVNGDGTLDIFWGLYTGHEWNMKDVVFYNDGNGKFALNKELTSQLFQDVKWGGTNGRTYMTDFNGDGVGDLIVLADDGANLTVHLFISHPTFG